MNYFFAASIVGGRAEFDQQESLHILRVLRMNAGDEICVLDGRGKKYAGILEVLGKMASAINLALMESQSHHVQIHIAVAPTKKADRMEWMVEKLVETGVHRITFMETEKGERSKINQDRLNKKALSALTQSGNLWMPVIETGVSFEKCIKEAVEDLKIIGFCSEGDKQTIDAKMVGGASSALMLVGPEGDFSSKEINLALQSGFTPVNLGFPRYRTETAALISCTLLNHFCVTLKANDL